MRRREAEESTVQEAIVVVCHFWSLQCGMGFLGLPVVKFLDALTDATSLSAASVSDFTKAAFIFGAMRELRLALVGGNDVE
jgi:hypothetical protein